MNLYQSHNGTNMKTMRVHARQLDDTLRMAIRQRIVITRKVDVYIYNVDTEIFCPNPNRWVNEQFNKYYTYDTNGLRMVVGGMFTLTTKKCLVAIYARTARGQGSSVSIHILESELSKILTPEVDNLSQEELTYYFLR